MRCNVCDGDLPVEVDEEGNKAEVSDWQGFAAAVAPVPCTCPPTDLLGEIPEEVNDDDDDWSNPIDSLFGPDEEEDSEEDPYGF